MGSDGTVYVAESFGPALTAIGKRGGTSTLARLEGDGDIAGVDARGKGTVVYTTTSYGEEGATSATLQRVLPNGRTRVLADLLSYEETVNPDEGTSYGFQGVTAECAEQVPAFIGGDPYPGIVEAHPYAVAIVPGGYVVADAGGNDLLHVAANGDVTTLAVLPPTAYVITEDVAAALGLPACTAGATYNFEAVPTDVELGPDGLLYVSTLPGGPEDGSLGALGAVYTVDPATGETTRIASGFLGAANVAVAPDGTVYVAELFGNRVSRVVDGGPETVVELDNPAGVEWADGALYVSYGVFGPGSVVRVAP